MRKKLTVDEKKVSVTLTLNPMLIKKVDELCNNKSKYVERLIYNDLLKKNKIDEDFEL